MLDLQRLKVTNYKQTVSELEKQSPSKVSCLGHTINIVKILLISFISQERGIILL